MPKNVLHIVIVIEITKNIVNCKIVLHSKAVHLLWIIYVIFVLVCYAFMQVCLLMPCGHLLGKG